MTDQYLILGCVFGAVLLLGYFATQILSDRQGKQLRERLSGSGAAAGAPTMVSRQRRDAERPNRLLMLMQRVGQAAAKPFMPSTREKQSGLRQSLARAGVYAPSAVKVMTGAKVIFLGGGLLGGYLAGAAWAAVFLGLPVGGLVGYMIPTFWLKSRIKSNQKALTYGLADALDLMVVCVEAGLTVDAAMQRVGQELALAHPALSRELGIAHMETRVGLSRMESLRNLGLRTGTPALQSLASMLIQADRFGTSIATALRIHAETLRQNRQHAAEELAAKASVKMTFPLVLFVFPATFIVLAGPTVLKMMESPLFTE
jgi:tight adherence protein C